MPASVGWLLRLAVIVLLVYAGLLGSTYVVCSLACRQDSSRSRIRAGCWSMCNCRIRPRSGRTQEVMQKVEKLARADARR